jgi:hypothetical protein
MSDYPYTPSPEDLNRLFEMLPAAAIPAEKADVSFIKSLGFSASSSKYLQSILKSLGFVDEADKSTGVWQDYLVEEKRGLVLAASLKKAYPELFENVFCPYLEDDDSLRKFFRTIAPDKPKILNLKIETFRVLSQFADFQDLIEESGFNGLLPDIKEEKKEHQVKVDPNMQVCIQVHIDPATPDDKIETIFKNMRKYLLGKED